MLDDLRSFGEVYAEKGCDALSAVQAWGADSVVISMLQIPELSLELGTICSSANMHLCTFSGEVRVVCHVLRTVTTLEN